MVALTSSSVRSVTSRGLQWLLMLACFAFLLFPLLRMVSVGLVALFLEEDRLSPTFWVLLMRSLSLNALQAVLSATLSVASGVVLGSLLGMSNGHRLLSRWLRFLGMFSFALPGMTVALLVLDLHRSFSWLPNDGLPALVFAHLILNAAFVAAALDARIRGWRGAGGNEVWESAALLGARRFSLLRVALGPLWRETIRSFFPLIFFYSFSAFATVLILGSLQGFASPEIMLFYSLQNDFRYSAIFVYSIVQFGVALAAYRMIVRNARSLDIVAGSGAPRPSFPPPFARWTTPLVALFSLPVLWLFISPFRLLATATWAPPEDFGDALFNSLVLVAFACASMFLLFFCLLFARAPARRLWRSLLGVSATLFLSGWLYCGWDRWLDRFPLAQLAAAGFLLALLQLPLCALWLEERWRSFPLQQLEAARVLGANAWSAGRSIVFPHFSDVLERMLLLTGLYALGDIALSSLFVHDQELLSTFLRKTAARYDFSSAQWLLLSLGAFTLAFFALGWARRRLWPR